MFLRDLPDGYKHGLILIGLLLIAVGVYFLAGIIAPFLVALVVAYVLNPLARLLERRKIPRPYAVLTIFVGGLLLSIIVVIPTTLTVLSEGSELSARAADLDVQKLAERYRAQGRDMVEEIRLRFGEIPFLKDNIDQWLSSEKLHAWAAQLVVSIKDLFVGLFKRLFSLILSAFSGVMGVFLIPLFTFYILVDLDLLYAKMVMLIPKLYRESTLRVLGDVDGQLSGLLRGQAICCCAFALIMSICLWLAGLKYSLFIGPIAGLANLVPYLGGLMTIVLAGLVALVQCGVSDALLWLLIKVAMSIGVVQAVDGLVLQPYIIGENAGLHPLAIMLALIIGGSLFGALGMILAVPTTCILKVISRELYHELYDET